MQTEDGQANGALSAYRGNGSDFLFIIGAMKSGTTSLWRLLAQHPEICVSREKEPMYFSDGLPAGESLEAYLDLWEFDSGRHRYRLEASTNYTKYPVREGAPPSHS